MRLDITLSIFLLGLVAIQALPTEKAENTLEKKNLNLEDAAEDKDRSKKSILCLETGNGPQSYSLQGGQPMQTLNIQAAAQPVQTLAIQQAPQPAQALQIQPAPVQTLAIQQAPQPAQTLQIQPFQSLNFAQQIQQPVQTVQIQPVQPPVQTLNFIQPPPAIHPATTTVIQQAQPCPQPQQTEVKVEHVPEVETFHHKHEKIVKTETKPEVVVHKTQKEQFVAPVPLVVVAEPEPQPMAFIKVPHCHRCQQSLMQCNCRPQAISSICH